MISETSTSPRRVAILGSRGFPSTYGGYETLVRHLASDWASQGLDVTVYGRTRDEGRRHWTTEGVECRWTPGRDSKSLSTLSFGLSSHLDASRRGFDAALVLNVANGFYLPVLRAAGTGVAVNTDGMEWERGKWGPTARRVFRAGADATARFADVVVADSVAISHIWTREFGVESEFIPYGAPVLRNVASHRVEELGFASQSYALVVARLSPENNVELILDALELLDTKVPTVIVGSANYESPLEVRLRHLDHSGHLRWLGHVSDQELLTQLWAHCAVYLHGHSVGGTNPGLLQALGAGAPTLALDTPFNAEVITASSQLFPPDKRALAGAINGVLGSSELQRRFSEQGRRIVAERYTWPDVSSRYLAALGVAMTRRRQTG